MTKLNYPIIREMQDDLVYARGYVEAFTDCLKALIALDYDQAKAFMDSYNLVFNESDNHTDKLRALSLAQEIVRHSQ